MKHFAIALSLVALVGLSACESSTTTSYGNAYPVTDRTAGHDDSVVKTRKAATRTFNRSLRK